MDEVQWKQDIERKVKEVFVERLGVAEDQVKNTASAVNDLGADSLDRVELVMALEDRFEIEIPDEDCENLDLVKQYVEYISKRMCDKR